MVVVARASLQRERFDFGDRNPGLAQNPLYTLEDGESIFIIADQGDAEVRILPLHVSLPSVRGGTAAARARAPSSVAAPLPSPSTKKIVPKLMRDDRADRIAIDDRDHARPLVFPQQRIVVRRADSAEQVPNRHEQLETPDTGALFNSVRRYHRSGTGMLMVNRPRAPRPSFGQSMV